MTSGRKPQYVTSAGYLSEDGITDDVAAWMAAFHRVPDLLTYREAMLAVEYMINDNRDSEYIALRLKISKNRAAWMMKKVRDGSLPR